MKHTEEYDIPAKTRVGCDLLHPVISAKRGGRDARTHSFSSMGLSSPGRDTKSHPPNVCQSGGRGADISPRLGCDCNAYARMLTVILTQSRGDSWVSGISRWHLNIRDKTHQVYININGRTLLDGTTARRGDLHELTSRGTRQ